MSLSEDAVREELKKVIDPELFVNITRVMDTKLKMLGCHESQRQWLDETQGLDDYIESMRQSSREVGRLAGQRGWKYAEGFRRHNHVGFAARERDLLAEVLAPDVERRGNEDAG